MNGHDLHSFFRKLNPDLWLTKTCDGFKYGDPATGIKGIAVSWMATISVIRRAFTHGHNFIITHEPTFYNHWDKTRGFRISAAYKRKIEYLSRSNMVIYRLHDTWDMFDTYGILDSWASSLDLKKVTAFDGYHKVYEIPSTELTQLARQIKRRMKLQSVRIVGRPQRIVTRVGLGVGAWGTIKNLKACMRMGADVFVTGETCEWQSVRFAEDSGICMIVVGHINSENFGIRSLARFLKHHFPDLKIEFLDANDPYRYL